MTAEDVPVIVAPLALRPTEYYTTSWPAGTDLSSGLREAMMMARFTRQLDAALVALPDPSD